MKFLVDRMCGRLAKWLRLLGYDASYVMQAQKPEEIIYDSLREQRVILTRNLRISGAKGFRVYHVKSGDFFSQAKEVVGEFKLKIGGDKIFTRCINCNGGIKKIEKREAEGLVPAYVYQTAEAFYCCKNCKKIYWKGSHLELARKILNKM
ncbi:MAG: Mut7-C RNAse domain-containing protein [bacterium]